MRDRDKTKQRLIEELRAARQRIAELERDAAEEERLGPGSIPSAMLDFVPAHIFVTDMDTGEVLFMNKSMQRDFGGDHVGRSCREVFGPGDGPCSACREGRPEGVRTGEHYNEKIGKWYLNNEQIFRRQDGRLVRMQIGADITKRREAEEALRKSEERFRAMFEDNSMVMLLIDPKNGAVVDGNDTAASFYGWSRTALRRMNIHDINILSENEVRAEIRAAREGQKRHFDFRHRLADGRIRDVEVFSSVVEAQGRPLLYSTIIDVTERKRTEKALRDSEERMALALDAVNDAVWDWRVDTGEMYYSPRWFTMLGYEPYEFPQQFDTWRNLVHAEDLPRAEKVVQEHLKSGSPFQMEFRMQTKDKGACWIHARGKTVERGEDGRPLRMLGTHVDITERKQAEEALAVSERRFRRMLENVDMVAVQGYDENRAVTYWNTACEILYGYAGEEALGRKLEDLIIPEDMRDMVVRAITRWMEEGEPIPAGPIELRNKDGDPVPVYSSHVMLDRPSGGKEMFCIDVDMREIRETHRRLVKAKEEAEAANRSKSRFLANMSHEIRTPVNGVMGMLQLLQDSALDEEQREFADLAVQACTRLARLMSDILDLSRVEAGKMELVNEPFSLSETFEAVKRLFSPFAEQKGLALEFFVDPAVPERIVGDAGRLQQILNNLTGNALKFTKTGFCRISAGLLPDRGGDAHRILFTVRDSGIGVSDESLKRLFEPFTQAEGSYTRTYQGAGLGLSIVKRLTTLMGGTIAVTGEEGVGTAFYLSIPFEKAAKIKATLRGEERIAPGADNPLRILLVEDDETSAFAAKRMLQSMGCRADVAPNGADALSALRVRSYDLAIMDVQMPVMDGVEAAQAVRRGEAGEENIGLPIVAMTAYAMAGDKEVFLEAGMDDYLAKPVEMGALRNILEKYGA